MSDFNMQEAINGVEPSLGSGGSVRPDAGDYKVMISKAGMASNKNKDGENLALEYTVLDGNFTGSILKQWLSVRNKNKQTVEIALGVLSAISAVTKYKGSDPEGLVGKSLTIRINKEPHEFVNDKGLRVNTFNNNVTMHMTLDHKNAKGDVVPAFIPSITSKMSAGAADSSVKGSSSIKQDLEEDSDIPF